MSDNLLKKEVKEIYDSLAKNYDCLHHLQTLWADIKYRKEAVKYTMIHSTDQILDVGTGTGLTAIEVAKKHQSCHITGIDISKKMLDQAKRNIRKKGLEDRIDLLHGDIENLPFNDGSFDVILSVYGLGGVQNISKAMNELIRTAKSGARITSVEMTPPPAEYPHIWKTIHKVLVEPWTKHFWGFRDLKLTEIFTNHSIAILKKKYYKDRIIGSTTLVSGKIIK